MKIWKEKLAISDPLDLCPLDIGFSLKSVTWRFTYFIHYSRKCETLIIHPKHSRPLLCGFHKIADIIVLVASSLPDPKFQLHRVTSHVLLYYSKNGILKFSFPENVRSSVRTQTDLGEMCFRRMITLS